MCVCLPTHVWSQWFVTMLLLPLLVFWLLFRHRRNESRQTLMMPLLLLPLPSRLLIRACLTLGSEEKP